MTKLHGQRIWNGEAIVTSDGRMLIGIVGLSGIIESQLNPFRFDLLKHSGRGTVLAIARSNRPTILAINMIEGHVIRTITTNDTG